MSINTAVIVGRMTKDAELQKTSTGKSVIQFTLAVNRDKEHADFISVVAWERMAENIAKYCGKGSMLGITGRIQTRNYENSHGQRVYVTEVLARDAQFLDTRGRDSQQAQTPQYGGFWQPQGPAADTYHRPAPDYYSGFTPQEAYQTPTQQPQYQQQPQQQPQYQQDMFPMDDHGNFAIDDKDLPF